MHSRVNNYKNNKCFRLICRALPLPAATACRPAVRRAPPPAALCPVAPYPPRPVLPCPNVPLFAVIVPLPAATA